MKIKQAEKNVNQLAQVLALGEEGSDLIWQAASSHQKVTLASVNSLSKPSRTGHQRKVQFP